MEKCFNHTILPKKNNRDSSYIEELYKLDHLIVSKLGVFHFQFLHLPLLIAFPHPRLLLHETPPNLPHLDSAVLTTTDNKGALQPAQRVRVRGGGYLN